MLRPPMNTQIPPGTFEISPVHPQDWDRIARTYLGNHTPDLVAALSRRLRERHDLPGIIVRVGEGLLEVSVPANLAGLEDGGWELLPEHA